MKITCGDVVFDEVNSINDGITVYSTLQKIKERIPDNTKQLSVKKVTKKKAGGHSYSDWTKEENDYLRNNFHLGRQVLMVDPALRRRHSIAGISSRIDAIKTKNYKKVPREVVAEFYK